MSENNTILIGERSEPSANAPSGKNYWWCSGGILYTKDDAGTVRSQQTPDFGKNYSLSIFEDYTLTTSGTSWDTYSGFKCPSDKVGKYLVFCNALVRSTSAGNNILMRLALNSSTVGEYLSFEAKDTNTNNRMPMTFIKEVTLASGDFLDLDFSTENTNVTLTVHEASLVLWRV